MQNLAVMLARNEVRMRARTLTEQRNTHPHEIPVLRPPGEGQLRNRSQFRNRTEKSPATQHLTFRTSDLACVPFIRVSWQ